MKSSYCVANKLLELANSQDKTLTPMQLLKLVYLCHGWMLGLYGRPMINEEIEAWSYGPVVRDLYKKVRKYKSEPVIKQLDCQRHDFDEKENDLISQVFQKYGSKSGIQLSQLTHMADSPWDITWKNQGKNSVISNDLIEDYFSRKATASQG